MVILCKGCGGNEHVKSGKMNKKQRYKCKGCGTHFTEGDGRIKYTDAQRLQALRLSRRSMSLRGIADEIGTNNVTILHWLRDFGRKIKERVLASPVTAVADEIIEIDEMWHYCKKNSKNYGYGLLCLIPDAASSPLKSAIVVNTRLSDSGKE